MAKQARSQVTREAILNAAGVVFSNLSYSAATLGDVVAEAGLTQGSLYFHFDSKHELALEVIKRQHEIAVEGMSAVGPELPGIDAIVSLSATIAQQIVTNAVVRGGMRLSTESPEIFPDYATRPYLDWIDACDALLRKAVSEGDVSDVHDIAALARFVMSAFTGVQVVSQSMTQWGDLYPRLREMWLVVLPAILSETRQADYGALAELVTAK